MGALLADRVVDRKLYGAGLSSAVVFSASVKKTVVYLTQEHTMRCMICGADPETQPVAIFRLNNKGQPGVWACRAHYAKAKAEHFPDDVPNAPAPETKQRTDDEALGPWTGGFTPA